MAWTSPKTWTSGDTLTAADLNTHVRDNQSFLHDAPSCRVYNSANLAVSNGVSTTLTFDSERWDTDTMHSTASNTSRITFTTAGKYLVGAHIRWTSSLSGNYRIVDLKVNGTTSIARDRRAPADDNEMQAVTVYDFSANDYIEVIVTQDSGGALNVISSTNYSPEFWALWVSG